MEAIWRAAGVTHLLLEGDHLEDDLLGAGEAACGDDRDAVIDFAAHGMLLAHRLLGELRLTLTPGQNLHLQDTHALTTLPTRPVCCGLVR